MISWARKFLWDNILKRMTSFSSVPETEIDGKKIRAGQVFRHTAFGMFVIVGGFDFDEDEDGRVRLVSIGVARKRHTDGTIVFERRPRAAIGEETNSFDDTSLEFVRSVARFARGNPEIPK